MRVVNIIKQRGCFLLLFLSLVGFILLSSQVQASTKNTNSSLEFLDNGRLTLNAAGVSLGTLLEEIQEKTNLEFQIHENLLKQPIFTTFQSLPLNDAIRRILHGLSYVCIFDSNGNVEKIITISNRSKSKESSFPRSTQERDLPYKAAEEIMSPPEMEDVEETVGITPPPEVEDIEEAMEVTPPPAIVKDLVEAIKAEGGTPPPELEGIMKAMETMPSDGEEDMDEPVETTLPPEVEDQVAAIDSAGGAPPPELEKLMEAMQSMPSSELENLDEAVEVMPPPEVVKNLVEAIEAEGGTPPPELKELVKAMGGMSPPEE